MLHLQSQQRSQLVAFEMKSPRSGPSDCGSYCSGHCIMISRDDEKGTGGKFYLHLYQTATC